MKKTKIVAAYLPQFHETENNNIFWGKGYTDWVAVKNAKKLFSEHIQPKVPFNQFYYDLSDPDSIRWQAKLANEYGIDAFNIYHYWFKNGKQELSKPAELILKNKDINIEFLFTWDNSSWVRSWSNVPGNDWAPSYDKKNKNEKKILLELDYGDEKQWIEHFYYLLPFFKDNRYVKIDGKPVFGFMRSSDIFSLKNIRDCWKKLAIQNGLPGIVLISARRSIIEPNIFDYNFLYEPIFSGWRYRDFVLGRLKKYFGINLNKNKNYKYLLQYDDYWKKLLKNSRNFLSTNVFLGGLVAFDDTPRRGNLARIINGATPKKFEKYFRELYSISCKSDKELLFLTAWNEWGEGAYLEPDECNEYGYLKALKSVKDGVVNELFLHL